MYRRLTPILLIENGRTVKSINFENNRYLGDPLNIVRIFNSKEIDEIVILDISASKKNEGPNFELAKSLAEECFIPCAYGGGIRNIDDATTIFSFGYDKIVIQTLFFENSSILSEISKIRGSQAVSLSLDVVRELSGKYSLYDYINREIRDIDLLETVLRAVELGCGEIIVNSVDRDGRMNGLDLDLVTAISQICKVPFTIAGGLRNFEDAVEAIRHGANAVAGGSFFSFKSRTKGILISYPKVSLMKNS